MLKDELSKQITDALKSGDQIRLSTLRLLSNALHNEEIAKQGQLTADDETAIVKRQLKQREEAIEALRQAQGKLTNASATDLEARIGQERQEATILKEFLPEQMEESELSDIVNQVIEQTSATNMGDFGNVMGAIMAKVKGQADGNQVAEIVKKRLSKLS